jgi:hypothetical protein
MDETSYLTRLTVRLFEGIQRLPADLRARHAGYLRAGQYADGGWSGREGGSDLYYTAFGLRGLMVLDARPPEISGRRVPQQSDGQRRAPSISFRSSYACARATWRRTDVLADSPIDGARSRWSFHAGFAVAPNARGNRAAPITLPWCAVLRNPGWRCAPALVIAAFSARGARDDGGSFADRR